MVIINKTSEFEKLKAGNYQAIILGNYDLGYQKKEFKGVVKFKETVYINFEVDERLTTGEYADQRFHIGKDFTKSLHPESALSKFLEQILGKNIQDDFDLDTLTGKNCMITVSVSEKGNSYISGFSPLHKKLDPIEIELNNGEPKWITTKRERNLIEYKNYLDENNPQEKILTKQEIESDPSLKKIGDIFSDVDTTEKKSKLELGEIARDNVPY